MTIKQTKPLANVSKKDAQDELWRRGVLRWKCHEVQKSMYDLFYRSEPNSLLCWLLARQSGKSYLLAILSLEAALKKQNSIIKLVTDTKLHLKSIFEPIFRELLVDCPEEIKPKYYGNTFSYYFPNGSQIQLAGSDGKHYEKLRGQKSDLILIDEAGFCKDLKDMVESVLMPTTTHTGGKIVLATTPPSDSTHDFHDYIERCEHNNTLIKKTIHDNPLLTKNQIQRIVERMGGEQSERFRREYLCEIVKNTQTMVIPEFTEEMEKKLVKEWTKPSHYDSYVSMDLGFEDLTVVLFLYYDFKNDKVIVEDELVANFKDKDMSIKLLTEKILEKENNIFLNYLTNEVTAPLIRVSDINKIVTNEISKYSNYKINFINAKKDDNQAAINNLRTMISEERIIINPRCKTLIYHLRNVKWKNSGDKTTFARSPDTGHYDAVDALKYGLRAINYEKNPYPPGYANSREMFYFGTPQIVNNDHLHSLKQIFGFKGRKNGKF